MNGAQLRAKMQGGEEVWGTMLVYARSLGMASVYGQLGFDFAIVDAEHTPTGRSEAADMAAALLAAGVCPVIRVPHTEPHATIMALDAGFHGLLSPSLETARQVRAVVSAARLRPLKGGLHDRASETGEFPSEETRAYLEKRNANVVVIVGIESVPAVEHIIATAQERGIPAGPHCFNEEQLVRWYKKGIRFVLFSADVRALGDGYRSTLTKVRDAAPA